ncbi:MAG: SDR family oxidoreductase, partial [Planctomycetota bacterium]
MAVFLTGSTGYIGGYLLAGLLERQAGPVALLVRAKTAEEAERRLWESLQLHLDFPRFREQVAGRLTIHLGDLTAPCFGLDEGRYRRLVDETDSVLHCAASLNRKSEKACLNVNLRGTLEVVALAMRAKDAHGLRRFSHVSTVAVAGRRSGETVREDEAVDWERSDYDPYARTKKFAEHMVRTLLPDVPRTIFRPSIVLGDSRRGETNQFEMVRAFVFLANLPVLPFRADHRLDIVPVDYVADAVVSLHVKERPDHEIYHLSSGEGSETFRAVTEALSAARGRRRPRFAPWLRPPFASLVRLLARRKGTALGHAGARMEVFLPYLTWNTVFDNA